MTDSFFNIHI